MQSNYTIRNRDGWSLTTSNESITVTDPFGLSAKKVTFIMEGRQRDINDVVEKVRSLEGKFAFQTFKQNDQTIILIGPYGLSGGGKYEALLASGGGFLAGIALTFRNRQAGQALMASSFNAAVYAYKTPADKFDDKECFAKAAMAGATSLATSTLTNTIGGPIKGLIDNSLAAEIVTQGAVNLIAEGANQIIKKELDVKKMAISVASSTAGVFVGDSVSLAVGPVKEIPALVAKAGLSGAASSGASTLTSDLLSGNSLDNVVGATLTAGVLSSISAIPGAIEAHAAIIASEKANQNIPKSPEPPKDKPTPPKKPDLSHLNLDKRKSELDQRELDVAKKEGIFSTAFNNARNAIAAKLNAGFHDKAKWAKTPEQTAARILNGEKVSIRKKEHIITIKANKIENPSAARSQLNNDKTQLIADQALANQAMAGYDADLKVYNTLKETQIVFCPPPPRPPAAPTQKYAQRFALMPEREERRIIQVRHLELRPDFRYIINHPYNIEYDEPVIEVAKQAVIKNYVSESPKTVLVTKHEVAEQAVIKNYVSENPKTVVVTKYEDTKPENGYLKSSELDRAIQKVEHISYLASSKGSLKEYNQKLKDIQKAEKHIQQELHKKDHAKASARDKKQKLTEQIEAHNTRLERMKEELNNGYKSNI